MSYSQEWDYEERSSVVHWPRKMAKIRNCKMCCGTGTMKRGIWLITRVIVPIMTFVMKNIEIRNTREDAENSTEDVVERRQCEYGSRWELIIICNLISSWLFNFRILLCDTD